MKNLPLSLNQNKYSYSKQKDSISFRARFINPGEVLGEGEFLLSNRRKLAENFGSVLSLKEIALIDEAGKNIVFDSVDVYAVKQFKTHIQQYERVLDLIKRAVLR